MNTIEKDLLDKIEHGFEECSYSNIEVAKSCASIVEKYAVGFSIWCDKNNWEIDLIINGNGVYYFNGAERYNQTLLFEKYIKSLNTDKP